MKDGSMSGVARIMTFIVAGVAVIAMVFTSVYTVDCAEAALVLRFGRYVRHSGPGLHIKVPLGIERYVKVPIERIFTERFGTAARGQSPVSITGIEPAEPYAMVTGDLNVVHVSWSIQYRISDPVAWAFKVAEQQKMIHDTSRSVMSLLIGDLTLADAMGE